MIIGWQCLGCYTRYELPKGKILPAPERCQVCNETVFTRLEKKEEGSDGLYPERKPEPPPAAPKYEDEYDHSYGYGRNLLDNPDMDSAQRTLDSIKEEIRKAPEPMVGDHPMTLPEISGKNNLVLTEIGIWMLDTEIKTWNVDYDIEWTVRINKQEIASGGISAPHIQHAWRRQPPLLLDVKKSGTIVEFDVQSTGMTSRKLRARKL